MQPGDIVLDATVGNGHDTRFLLDLIQPSGKVFGFDIQLEALTSTREQLSSSPYFARLSLLHASHAEMAERIPAAYRGKIKTVMFNLGYLPGGGKQVITQTDTTLAALNGACALLSTNGIITVIAYPGHAGGKTEAEQVNLWCNSLDCKHYQCERMVSASDNPTAPVLFVINKIA